MRKGTKQIRRVNTGTGEYYVYDLDADAFGKRKRLYGKSEEEIREKIRQAQQEKQVRTSVYKPKTKLLSEYILYYFRHAVGSIAFREISRLTNLCEKVIFSNEINKSIDEISSEDINSFYDYLATKYASDNVKDIDNILRKVFEIAKNEGTVEVNIFEENNITLPAFCIDSPAINHKVSYILKPEEFESLLTFCIEDNCMRYGKNEQVIIFCMLTGLKFSALKKIKVNDIDLEKNIISCEGREVSLSARAVDWLTRQKEQGSLPSDDLLFINSNGVSPTAQSIQYTLDSITKRQGFPKGITGAMLWKSYVISELDKGTTPNDICRQLGFSTVNSIVQIQDEYETRKLLFG